MSETPAALSARFNCSGLRFETGPGGLTRAVVETAAVRGAVFLQGAHVAEWQPAGHGPVLWLSQASQYAAGRPIRGGVPICFPWFGPHPSDCSAPPHGLARTADWQLSEACEVRPGELRLELTAVVSEFQLRFTVELGQTLQMQFQVHLPPNATAERTFEEALHTYLTVGDIHQVRISGLEAAAYIDKVGGLQRRPATGVPIQFEGETDRVYQDTTTDCVLRDPILQRIITVGKSGSRSTVVWNPWIDKSARMPDFGDQEWPQMLCIETANVAEQAIRLQPGEAHMLEATVSVRAL